MLEKKRKGQEEQRRGREELEGAGEAEAHVPRLTEQL